ncbi:MAG: ribose 5-phosphate isomerase B [Elusimicrobia bacterium]|nr:ribose 5-phosphate isomerase B [Elusimicrobiota bacterium]
MRIAIGADHAGYRLKTLVGDLLRSAGHRVVDFGTHSERPADYPDYARKVALAVATGKAERGIMVCGSGVGASVAANKVPGARAGLCHDTFSARQGVEDDNVNILCLGERVVGSELALEIVRIWMKARFSGAARHVRRLKKVAAIEAEFSPAAAKRLGR